MSLAEVRRSATLWSHIERCRAGDRRRCLATISQATRRRERRGELRAAVPVSMREGTSTLGNQVSFWLLPLPVAEKDPEKRVAAVHSATTRRKQ